jgi:hypothetical protein
MHLFRNPPFCASTVSGCRCLQNPPLCSNTAKTVLLLTAMLLLIKDIFKNADEEIMQICIADIWLIDAKIVVN